MHDDGADAHLGMGGRHQLVSPVARHRDRPGLHPEALEEVLRLTITWQRGCLERLCARRRRPRQQSSIIASPMPTSRASGCT